MPDHGEFLGYSFLSVQHQFLSISSSTVVRLASLLDKTKTRRGICQLSIMPEHEPLIVVLEGCCQTTSFSRTSERKTGSGSLNRSVQSELSGEIRSRTTCCLFHFRNAGSSRAVEHHALLSMVVSKQKMADGPYAERPRTQFYDSHF